MKLNEILYADKILPIDWENIDLTDTKLITTIDNHDIVQFNSTPHSFYLICDKNKKVLAYATIEAKDINGYFPLVRMENIAKIKGLITIIIFAITLTGKKLIIQETEELTPDGLLWISKLLINGSRGLIITDQQGNNINFADLSKQHTDAEIAVRAGEVHSGNTAILISNSNNQITKKIIENIEKWESSSLIKPNPMFLYSNDLW